MIPTEGAAAPWSREEIDVAANLHEQAVLPEDIANTLNRLFKTCRTPVGVKAKMRAENVRFGASLTPEALEAMHPEYMKMRRIGHIGGVARAVAYEDAERPRPWHPARDPKPEFLRRQQA